MAKKAVAKTSASSVPEVYDYGEDAGRGFEGIKGSDLSIAFLNILQSNSPQVEQDDPKGSRPGMLYNTVTKELYKGDVGVCFVPCYHENAYVEWIPRDKGSGFVGLHDPEGEVVKNAILEKGTAYAKLEIGDNDLIETFYVYGLILDDSGRIPLSFAVLSFSSTKIKPWKDWQTAMYTLRGQPPIFANRAMLRTVKQKNEHGTFFNFKINPFGETYVTSLINPVTDGELLKESKGFMKMAEKGLARADFSSERSTGVAPAGGGDAEDAPF